MKAAALALVLLVAGCGQSERKAEPQTAPALRFEQARGTDANPRAAAVRHGRRLARVLGCEGCHGADLTGRPWDEEPELAISFTSNLTRAMPGYSDAQLEQAIRIGVRPDGSALWGMPSEIFTHLDASDLTALIAYLRTVSPTGAVHPRPVFGPRGRAEIARGEYRPAPQLARAQRDLWPARLDGGHDPARYMTRATCGECHRVDLGDRGGPPI